MRITTRCREYREGRIGRNRTYTCRKCQVKFKVFTRYIVPRASRLCVGCHVKEDINGIHV
jgi:hypothetical protein